jgi:hypothetical protein
MPLFLLTSGAAALACSADHHSTPAPEDGGVADAARPDIDSSDGDSSTPDGDSSTPDGGRSDAQMNDLSILFPLGHSQADIDSGHLSLSSSGARGALLPAAVYKTIGPISGLEGNPNVGSQGTADYANIRIVGLRVDPCFASLAPSPHGDGCKNQLRLVAQELSTTGSNVDAFDSAMHLFYSLSRAELQELVRALVTLRAAQAPGVRLGKLAPHPVMVQQGLDGPMAQGVRDLVLRYAGASNLTRVTKLSMENGGFQWRFAGFDVTDVATSTVASMHIPTLPAGSDLEQIFFRGFTAEMQGTFTAHTSSKDDLALLANLDSANAATADARKAAFGALLRVENPTKNSPDTIDCASCHLATPVSDVVAGPKFALSSAGDPDAFSPDPAFVDAAEMAHTFDDGDAGALNVHAFSYVGDRAGINQRTVNETAAVVAYVNANVLP